MDICPKCGRFLEDCRCSYINKDDSENELLSKLENTIAGLESLTSVIEEVKDYGENISTINSLNSEIDPEFTLFINGVHHADDKQKILSEFADPILGVDISDIEQQIDSGFVIIKHIREMKGVVIANRLKDIDCSFFLAPSDEMQKLFPQIKSQHLKESSVEFINEAVVLSTGEHISGKKIIEYINLVWVEKCVSNSTFSSSILQDLSESLKNKAKEQSANAVVGIQLKIFGKQPDLIYILMGTAVRII